MSFVAASSSGFDLVTKVGAVVLHRCDGEFEILVIQPKPKAHSPEDLPPIGLVRGTRAMTLADGHMVDANHDGRTPPPADAVLELLEETLAREIEEEAGVTRAMLAAARIYPMGAQLFASKKKTPYPIHWFIVVLDDASVATLPLSGMQDSLYSAWVSLVQLQDYVAQGKASPGYITVVEEALNQVSGV